MKTYETRCKNYFWKIQSHISGLEATKSSEKIQAEQLSILTLSWNRRQKEHHRSFPETSYMFSHIYLLRFVFRTPLIPECLPMSRCKAIFSFVDVLNHKVEIKREIPVVLQEKIRHDLQIRMGNSCYVKWAELTWAGRFQLNKYWLRIHYVPDVVLDIKYKSNWSLKEHLD